MIKKPVIALMIALTFLVAACSKQAPLAPAQDDDDEATTTAPAAAVEQPQPKYDYAKMAQGMMSLLAHGKPECQRFHDELQAMIDAPPGSIPPRDPSHVVAEAHDAGCSTKSAH